MQSYQVIVDGKRVQGYETNSVRRAKAMIRQRYPTAYAAKSFDIVSPPVGASVRIIHA